ncbi:MAG: alpha-glucan family phosphorylase [Planctomycetota bacterium]
MAKKATSARTSRATKKRSVRRVRGANSDALSRVDALARNMWWTWNTSARRLMESLDPALYRACGNNPIKTIQHLHPTRRDVLLDDADFASRVREVEDELKSYLGAKTWFQRSTTAAQKRLRVAYFCMEYGIQESLPLYAGGLGILAGDHLKSSSDLGIPLVAIGILWRKGYYRQEVKPDGGVRVLYPESHWDELPFEDLNITIDVPIGRKTVKAKLWKLDVGRVPLYLLDCDLPENSKSDRLLTHHLYGGGEPEYRVRQEMLLGVGGLLALDALGIEPTVCHLNEGHAAFAGLERMRRLTDAGHTLDEAVDAVRASSVFTTHTPVPEGNDRFDPALTMRYIKPITDEIGLSRDEALAFGREDISDKKEPFCMTVLALKLAEHCNGVAKLHGETARKMWVKTYDAKSPKKVPIGHVTNGVHPETWLSDDARLFYDKHLKPDWVGAGPDDDWWKKASKIPADEMWGLRNRLRRKLIAFMRERMRDQIVYHEGNEAELTELFDVLDENALTIGFARRFALYKRAPLIFSDRKRLAKLFNNPDRPVQLIFAGKAHPLDAAGHDFVRRVYEMTQHKDFRGRIWLLQNYDMEIGRMLTQGCDVWLNNPVRPMEASGTSGMKCPLNGGLNCSILDGWWPEGYNRKNGWAIGDGEEFSSRAKQDKFDAQKIYEVLEDEVVQEFYERNRAGVPTKWVKRMANAMMTNCCEFSSHRMIRDYVNGYYLPAHSGG